MSHLTMAGLDRASSSLSTFLNSDYPHPGAFVQVTRNLFYSSYDALHTLVSSVISAHPASGIATTELADLESGVSSQEPEDDPFDDAGDTEDVRQLVSSGEQRSIGAMSPSSYRALMWMAARFIGPLCLIVVPGLLLGLVTGQLPWGIALCGVIATVLSFFVSLKK